MQKIPVKDLQPGKRHSGPLYLEDGERLLLPGQAIDPTLLEALEQCAVDYVVKVDDLAEVERLRRRWEWREVPLDSLQPGTFAAADLFDEEGGRVLGAGTFIDEQRLKALSSRRIQRLYEKIRGVAGQEFHSRHVKSILRALYDAPESQPQADDATRPLAESWTRPDPARRSLESVTAMRDAHLRDLEQVQVIFASIAAGEPLDLQPVVRLVERVFERVAADFPLAVHLAQLNLHDDYLVDHALATAVLALAAGAHLPYTREQLLELGMAALLMDAGMLRVPSVVREKPGALNDSELQEVRRHPAHAVDLMQDQGGADLAVYYGIYQSHERMDGRGYPLGLPGARIHSHARLLAIVDTFEAITSSRPYKNRQTPSRALEHVLKMLRAGLFDGAGVKALLSVLSLYPVGSWVELTTGYIARVVAPNAADATRPLVAILQDAQGELLPVPLFMDLAGSTQVGIHRSVDDHVVPADYAAGFHADAVRPVEVAAAAQPAAARARSQDQSMAKEGWTSLSASASFSGDLRELALVDVFQLISDSQKSGLLTVTFPSGTGRILFAAGEMLSASFAGQNDEEAVYLIIKEQAGSFSFEQRDVDQPKRMKASTVAIIMEACRRLDEKEGAPPPS